MALILISHDLGVVAHLADRIAVMYGGQIVELARAREIFAQPIHPYTQALLAAAPRLDGAVGRLAAIPGTIPSAARWPDGCRFHPRCGAAWPRCRTEWPPLLETAPQHRAGCWLVEEPERRPS